MFDWLKKQPAEEPDPNPQNELQALRLERTEAQQRIAQLTAALQTAQLQSEEFSTQKSTALLEALFRQAASAASQLRTQAYLHRQQSRPLDAEDVLRVAERLLQALEDAGLSPEGQPGEIQAYDPARHTPLDPTRPPTPGQPVLIRLAGSSYQGKILHKAGVELP